MNRLRDAQREGSSLLEIVIVVASIAIVAAISIPRMSRGSGTANDSTMAGCLAALQGAVDQYAAEHGGTFPTAAQIDRQLTQYTDISGRVSVTRTFPFVYGPYLSRIPTLPVGVRSGKSRIATTDAEDVGWLYSEASGKIAANTTTEVDRTQGLYRDY